MTITFPGHSASAVGFEVPLAQADVSGFAQLYERHIAREESELLPMSQRLLSDAELDRVGLAMRMRRAVPCAPAHPGAGMPDHSRASANGSTLIAATAASHRKSTSTIP